MKLILTAAVNKVGVAGDIVDVKPGYGRNFLLPQGYAFRGARARRSRSSASSVRATPARSVASSTPSRYVSSSRPSVSLSPPVRVEKTASCTAPSPRPMSWPR